MSCGVLGWVLEMQVQTGPVPVRRCFLLGKCFPWGIIKISTGVYLAVREIRGLHTLGLMHWAFGFCWPRTVRVTGNGTSLSSKRGPKFRSLTRSELSSDPVVNTLVGPGNATYFTLCDLHCVIPLPAGCVESVLNEGEVGRLALWIRA